MVGTFFFFARSPPLTGLVNLAVGHAAWTQRFQCCPHCVTVHQRTPPPHRPEIYRLGHIGQTPFSLQNKSSIQPQQGPPPSSAPDTLIPGTFGDRTTRAFHFNASPPEPSLGWHRQRTLGEESDRFACCWLPVPGDRGDRTVASAQDKQPAWSEVVGVRLLGSPCPRPRPSGCHGSKFG